MAKLTEIFRSEAAQLSQWTSAMVAAASTFRGACILCFCAQAENAFNHTTTDCKSRIGWVFRGAKSSRSKTFYSSADHGPTFAWFKRECRDELKTRNTRVVCFLCMYPKNTEFHPPPDEKLLNSTKGCFFVEVCWPAVWLVRNSEELRCLVMSNTDGVVESLDDFEEFAFTPADRRL